MLLVPVLTQVADVPLDRAVAASLLGFLIAGVYAAFVHLRRARLDARPVVVLCFTAAAGAAAGAATLDWLPASAVRLFIAVLCLASGLHALLLKALPFKRTPSSPILGMLGGLVGYASAISGTGGPVTLIPLLLALRTPAAAAVALGLAAQLPIALSATVVYALEQRIDLRLGATLGALLVAGTYVGAKLSGRLSGRGLTMAVALTLVGVGLWYGYATLAG
ncbi:MAG TPA: sulfite exporter TauE/SafE family protein [Burkholderiales bacterium]